MSVATRVSARLTMQQNRVYGLLIKIAEKGERCPSSMALAERLETSPSYVDSVIAKLQRLNMISVAGGSKGRVITIAATGKTTAGAVGVDHWRKRAVGIVGIAPSKPVTPGRYLLDTEGRLQPLSYRGFVRAVAIVTVKPRPLLAAVEVPKVEEIKPETQAKPATTSKIRLDPNPPRRDSKPLRPMARRTPKPPRDVTVREEGGDEAFAEFMQRLASVKARREAGEVVAVKRSDETPKGVDWARIAAAHRAKKPTPQRKKPPTQIAPSTGECPMCGIPGRKGCDHFLPYDWRSQ